MTSQGSLSGRRKRFIALISALHRLENKHVCPEKWISSKGGVTAYKPPVSSNVKLICLVISWKTVEMPVDVTQQRLIEILWNIAQGRGRRAPLEEIHTIFSQTQIKLMWNVFIWRLKTLYVNVQVRKYDFISYFKYLIGILCCLFSYINLLTLICFVWFCNVKRREKVLTHLMSVWTYH